MTVARNEGYIETLMPVVKHHTIPAIKGCIICAEYRLNYLTVLCETHHAVYMSRPNQIWDDERWQTWVKSQRIAWLLGQYESAAIL